MRKTSSYRSLRMATFEVLASRIRFVPRVQGKISGVHEASAVQGLMRYELLSDESGHDYVVPVGNKEEFYAWVDAEGKVYDGNDFEECRVTVNRLTFTDPQGYR